ncbi:FecR domain-containing protein [Alloalcanivorax xenomutans]|uniref:FecR domain-containing protein n=1 Tax=Alloalcanivorax xenomutans TaxID=1094342 RepID=UPI003BA9BE3A
MSSAEVPDEALEQAARWFALLGADNVSEEDRAHWRQWLNVSAGNQRAWDRVERIDRAFHAMPVKSAGDILSDAGRRRRRLLRGLGGGLLLAPLGWWGWQQLPAGLGRADLRTAVGEIREVTLPDGSRLWLNTHSAVSLDFSSVDRQLHLWAGELYLETARDTRPMRVTTALGSATPLGTSFGIRLTEENLRVRVDRGRVAVNAAVGDAGEWLVEAGQGVVVDGEGRRERIRPSAEENAWRDRLLVANGRRLGDFLDELARYRRGVLRYDPSVADLKLSGGFPLDDTDRILQVLEATLPVKVTRLTPWWVKVESVSR